MNRSAVPYIVITCVVVLFCCLCGIVLFSTGILYGADVLQSDLPDEVNPLSDVFERDPQRQQPTPIVIRPDESSLPVSYNTLETLENTVVPISNLRNLAQRLEGKENIPLALAPVTEALTTGATDTFWVTNTDTNENFQIDATLQYVTAHTYFWVENGLRYNKRDLKALAETFENQIYPLNREYFGSEWTPGVDGDPHLYIIYARGLGRNLAGYYSSADQYHMLAHEYSNMHETFMLNANNLDFGEEYTYGVLAHEFQHMIHWHQDRNEEAWINEGLSELAAYINGYNLGGFDFLYTRDPDLQLTDWPNDPSQTSPHYGASFLFMGYFLDRFGASAIQSLAKNPGNGMASVDDVLAGIEARDPLTGKRIQADDLFLDWVLASYLQDGDILDGRYGYLNDIQVARPEDTELLSSCQTDPEVRDVHQYGVDYIRISCAGDFTLRFEGSIEVDLLPVDPYSGDYAFWSNKGDDSNMTLTRSFDFREHTSDLTLSYWIWYDLEEDYDYVYLEASLDGDNWQILTTPSGTLEDPSGNSFGWGYNGLSAKRGRWIQETIDISPFAGKEVHLRFEYITDAAVNGEGFLIDDVSIPEVGYKADFETGSDGWESAGFVRVENVLPQTFRIALIDGGINPQVSYIEVGPGNSVEIPLHLAEEPNDVVLVVTGTTRYTRQKASYQFQVTAE
jgi:hypothetical protein